MALPVLAMLVAASDLIVAGATAETRAGESPIVPGQPPRAFVAEVLVPELGLQLGRPGDMFTAFYSPRIVFQKPNPLDQIAPLVMHYGQLALTTPLSRRVTLTFDGDMSYGKPDYAMLVQLFTPQAQAQLPQLATTFSATGRALLRIMATRRLELSVAASVFHYEQTNAAPIRPEDIGNGAPLTYSTAVNLQPVATYKLSRVDRLVVDSSVTVTSYFSSVQVLTGFVMFGLRSRLSPMNDLTIAVGPSFVRDLGSIHVLASDAWPIAPAGEIRLDSKLVRQRLTALFSRIGSRVDYNADPVLGTAVPRAVVYGQLVMVLNPDWTFAPEGDFGTALRTTPLPNAMGQQNAMGQSNPPPSWPDETSFSVVLPFRRRLSPHFALELGARWTDRGPALAAPGFEFHQRQLYGYFALTTSTRATGRSIGP